MSKSPAQRRYRRATAFPFLLLAVIVPIIARPQSTTVRGSDSTPEAQAGSQIIDAVRQAQGSNQVTAVEIRKQLERSNCQLTLPPVGSTKLTAEEIRQRAQQARLRVGWVYQCIKCDEWHANLSGGYALTTNGAVATCYHVVNPPRDFRAGTLIAADHRVKVFPVTEVLAANRYADACVIQVKGEGFTPLSLNTNISIGDTVYCLSNDRGEHDAFTQGVVKRFLQLPERRRENVRGAPTFTPLRIQVSVTFEPGSSGSAVLDEFGNAIGHASTITLLDRARSTPAEGFPPQPTSHEATSVRDILSLISP
jgi:S1-C subfamily serine protease